MLAIFRGQPRAFNLIFMLEIWERFGYYTMQGVLTLYFIRFLGFSETEAYFTFGAFSALVFGMVAIGGYLGDHVLGTKRTIALGLITLAAGYFFLAIADKEHIFYALGLICTGNGLFKANPSNLLSKCYKRNDPRLHSGFTLYYMAINLGSTFSLLIGPSVASHFGYSYTYFLSCIGLVLGLANYGYQRHLVQHITSPAERRSIPYWQWGIVVLGILATMVVCSILLQHAVITRKILGLIICIVIGLYYHYMRKENRASYLRMLIAFILMLEAVVFFVLYQQMPTSLTLFAVRNVTPTLLGIPIDAQSFRALNPIWIIIMSPVLAMGYNQLNRRGIAFSVPYKFAAGMLCCSASFMLLFFSRFVHNDAGIVSSGWLVASYFFLSTGELFVSALGAAMVAELVPDHITGFVMGMWFLTSAIAGFIGASVASLTSLPIDVKPGIDSLMIYSSVFAWIGLVTFCLGLFMWFIAARLSRYIKVDPIDKTPS